MEMLTFYKVYTYMWSDVTLFEGWLILILKCILKFNGGKPPLKLKNKYY